MPQNTCAHGLPLVGRSGGCGGAFSGGWRPRWSPPPPVPRRLCFPL